MSPHRSPCRFARLDDLTATMRTVIATRPHLTSREWAAWSARAHVPRRYPSSLGLAYAHAWCHVGS